MSKRLLRITFATLFAVGCTTDTTIRHPDAPTLIVDTRFHPLRGPQIRGSAWDTERGELVDIGWVSASEYTGWTVSKFDWEAFDAK